MPPVNGTWPWIRRTGDLVFLPPGAVGMTDSKARIIPMGAQGFDEVRQAPNDTALYIGD